MITGQPTPVKLPRYELTLYKTIKPNAKGHLHYVYNDVNNFLDKLEPYEALSVDPSKYTMLNGSIKLLDIEPINYKEITYIAFKKYQPEDIPPIKERPIETQFLRVTNSIHISGSYIFDVELDTFANYIDVAKLNSIFVKRCNRKLPNIKGFEEAVEGTYFDGNRKPIDGSFTMNIKDINIVLIVNHVTFQNSWTKEYETITEPLTINLKELIDAFKGGYEETIVNYSEIFTITNQLISNMYFERLDARFDIKILKAYIIPKEYLRLYVNDTIFYSVAKSHLTKNKDKIISFNTYLLQVSDIKKLNIIDKNELIGTKNYIGTFNNGLLINNPVNENANIYTEVEITYNAVKVIIGEGDNIKDITNSFEFRPTGNSKELDTSQKIGMAINDLVGVAKNSISIGTNVASGNYASAVSGGLGMLNDMTQRAMTNRGQASGQDGVTDAFLTYTQNNSYLCNQDNLQNPFYIHSYISYFKTKINLRLNGAIYENYFDNTLDLEAFELIGEENSIIELSKHTFLQANCEFDNLQDNVNDFIKQEFANGLYYEYL